MSGCESVVASVSYMRIALFGENRECYTGTRKMIFCGLNGRVNLHNMVKMSALYLTISCRNECAQLYKILSIYARVR